MNVYEITGRVFVSQTDTNQTMKLTSAMDMIQDCSQFWMQSEPEFLAFLNRNRLAMLILSRQVEILRLPVYGERLRVTTGIFENKGFYGYRNTVLYGEDGTPCLLTWSTGVFANLETGRMMRIPREEADRLTYDPKVDMPYRDRRIALPDVPFDPLPPVPVRRNDIDLNHHMNNIRYLETALELLPEDFRFRRFRVEYKQSARLGDLLYPGMARDESGLFVTLSDARGQPYTIMEFS